MIATEISLLKEFSADRVHSDQFKTLTSLSDVRHFLNARGYIKSYAWKYEHETRIVVTLPDTITNPPKQIAISFVSAIANASFTLGPCTTASHAEEFGLVNCHQSRLHGLARMKSACAHCDYNQTPNCPIKNI